MAQHHISFNDSTGPDDDLFNRQKKMTFLMKQAYAESVFICVLSVVEIPVMILTLIALCFIVKSRPVTSVFIGHLIFSDLIQVICIISAKISWSHGLFGAHFYSLIASLYFMACVSFERYLLVSHPIWYKSHQSLKLSCFISGIIWFVPLTFAKIDPPRIDFQPLQQSIACLIPYPIIILCFVGTCRGLSHSISLSALQRKLILGTLFLVLLTYTFLILPAVLIDFFNCFFSYYDFSIVAVKFYYYVQLLLFVNPLADCILYLFIRPDVGDLMNSVHCCCCCCCRLKHNQDEHSVVNPQNSCSTVVCCISAQKPSSHSLNTFSSV